MRGLYLSNDWNCSELNWQNLTKGKEISDLQRNGTETVVRVNDEGSKGEE